MSENSDEIKKKRNSDLTVVISALLILAVSSFLAVKLFLENYENQQMKIKYEGEKIISLVEHELSIRSFVIKALKLMAEQFLEERLKWPFDVSQNLVEVPEKNGYALKMEDGRFAYDIGSITGIGKIPEAGTPAADEMEMSLYLTPIFRTIIERSPKTPWVYYTSLKGFMYLYPRVSSDEFFFSEKIFQMDFVRGASAEINPKGEVFWSKVYDDLAGKGLMVTASAPVVRDGTVAGAVSTDISTGFLDWLILTQKIPHSEIYLMYKGGLKLAGSNERIDKKIDPADFPEGSMVAAGPDLITVFPLSIKNWYLVLKTDRESVISSAFLHALPLIIVILFLFVGLILIVKLLRALRMVRFLSTQDGLTGVWNRRMFDQVSRCEFSRIQRQKSNIGMIIADIDYFKQYNDTYGHHAGDQTLVKVADGIKNALRRSTDKVFRVGGEEFAALTLAESEEKLVNEAESIRESIASLNIVHRKSPYGKVTISVGSVMVKGCDDPQFDSYYKRADEALYRSKNSGRNRVSLWVINSALKSTIIY